MPCYSTSCPAHPPTCRAIAGCTPNEYTNCLHCRYWADDCDAGTDDGGAIDAGRDVSDSRDARDGADVRDVRETGDTRRDDTGTHDAIPDGADAVAQDDEDLVVGGGGCACGATIGPLGVHGALLVLFAAAGLLALRRDRARHG